MAICKAKDIILPYEPTRRLEKYNAVSIAITIPINNSRKITKMETGKAKGLSTHLVKGLKKTRAVS